MTKRTNRSYTAEFKQEAIALVTEQDYSVSKAAASLGITDKLLSVLIAVQRKNQFAYSEYELGLIESIDLDKSVRKFFYGLPQELTTELGLHT